MTDGDRERLREGITGLLRSLAGDGFGPVWVDEYAGATSHSSRLTKQASGYRGVSGRTPYGGDLAARSDRRQHVRHRILRQVSHSTASGKGDARAARHQR